LLLQPSVQTYLTRTLADNLSEQTGARIEIGGVDIDFFSKLVLEDVYIGDLQSDTLLLTQRLVLDIAHFDWNNKAVDLKNATLEGATINLIRRQDTDQFNFQFLVDALSSPDTTAADPLKLSLSGVSFSNVKVLLAHEAKTEDIRILIPSGSIGMEVFEPANKRIIASAIRFDGLGVHYFRKEWSLPIQKIDPDDLPPVQILPPDWEIAAQQIHLSNTTFTHVNEGRPTRKNAIDFNRLGIDSIEIDITGFQARGDSILGTIDHLSLVERTGFRIQRLSTQAMISTDLITCDSLEIVTDNSHITHSYSMSFRSLRDFNRFDKRVRMDAKLDQAKVSFIDLAYFIPNLDPNPMIAKLDGRFRGRVNNLKGRDVFVSLKGTNSFKGDINISGLPNIRESFIDMEADRLRTTASEMIGLFPTLKGNQELLRLGNMQFTGTFIGFFKDFVTNGHLQTDMGTITTDINLKLAGKQGTFFSGKLKSRRFELGKMLGQDPTVGALAADMNIFGSGRKLDDIDAKLQASIESLSFKGYTYKDLVVDGQLDQRLFSGLLVVKDENLGLDFEGTVDLNQERPDLNFTANIRDANLGKLNFFTNEYIVNTKVVLDLEGKTIDDVTGTMDIFGSSIQFGDKTYAVDSLRLESKQNGKRLLSIESPVVNGHMEGVFHLGSLGGEFRKYVDAYLPFLELQQKEGLRDQNFDFELGINDPQDLIEFLIPELSHFDRSVISGNYDSKTNDLQLSVSTPNIVHNKRGYEDLKVEARSTKAGLAVSTFLERIVISDSLQIDKPKLFATIRGDSIFMQLQAGADSARNLIDLKTLLLSRKGLLKFQVLPSDIVLNGQRWDVTTGNEIIIKGRNVSTNNFRIGSQNQSLTITSDSANTLNGTIQNIRIDDLSQLLNPSKHPIGGSLSGEIKVADPLGEPELTAVVSVAQLTMDQDLLGDLRLRATTDRAKRLIGIQSFITNKSQRLTFTGNYHLDRPDSALAFSINLAGLQIKNFERFVSDIFSDTKGLASGYLKLRGSLEKPYLLGGLQIKGLKTRVNYLNVPYQIDKQIVEFTQDQILIKDMTISDTLGNTARATGHFYHTNFKKLGVDIAVEMDKMLLLNTTPEQNALYYGTGIGGGSIAFKGLFSQLKIDMVAKTMKGTKITVPIDDETTVDQGGFVTFIQKGPVAQTGPQKALTLKGMDINIDLEVTPEADVTMILDPEAGDMIRGAGLGNIKMTINTLGDFNMYGTFEIDRGDYLFTLYNSLINKRFQIDAGGTVSWAGDPYGAQMNMRAIYGLRASPYPLVQNADDLLEDEKNAYRRRIPVDVYLNLSGTLLASNPTFDIIMTEDEAATGSILTNKIAEVKQDENELNKQVFGLLVLNSFMSEFLSAQLSSWASEFTEDLDVYVNYYSGGDLGGTSQEELTRRRELQLALTKRFFNDRVSVDIGGNIDLESEYRSQEDQANNIAGDFTVEYRITEDGKVRVKVFRETDYDVLIERNRTKTGVGIFYRREFDKVKDLFKKKG
jgi:hypothetical protein